MHGMKKMKTMTMMMIMKMRTTMRSMTTTAVAVTVSITAPKMITMTDGTEVAVVKAITTGRQPTATTTGGQAIVTAAGIMKDHEVPVNTEDQDHIMAEAQAVRAGLEVQDQDRIAVVHVDNAAMLRDNL